MNITTWIINNKFWLLLGTATVFNGIWIMQYKEKLRIKEWLAFVLAILHMFCSVLFAKAFAFMEGTAGGMSLYGGHFGLPILFCLVAWMTKRNIADVCDVFTIPTIVTVTCARINCVFSGCCLGVIIPGTDGIRWPTRELELILYVVLYIFLRNKIGKSQYRGKLYPIYMISYGTFRFIIEWFRETTNMVSFAHLSHIWSIVAIVIGSLMLYLIDKKHTKDGKRTKGSNFHS